MKSKKIMFMFLMLAVLLPAGFTDSSAKQAARLETEVKTKPSTAAVLMEMLKKLPRVWRAKQEAQELAASLPEYRGEVSIPSSALIYSWIEALAQHPHRRPGTPEGLAAEQWVADKMRELGLENVTMDPVPITVWRAARWSLSVEGEEIPAFYVVNTGSTGAEGLTARLVYVGEGRPQDLIKVDVAGKIVVADVPFPKMPTGFLMKVFQGQYALSDPEGHVNLKYGQYLPFVRMNFIGGTTQEDAPATDVYWNSVKAGAKAVCLILKDQPSNSNTHYGPYDGIMKPLPALWIGKYDGMRLRELAQAGKTAALTLESSTEPGLMHNVWGVLPGMSEEVILLTSHHDAPFQGAVEDGAGVAQVLAQAWAWTKVPKEQRPKTLVFVVDAGHFYGSLGAHTFARQHPEIMDKTRILITLEHLGAKEVEERDREYAETGRPAFTVMFTSSQTEVIAAAIEALEKTKPKVTAAIPADFFGPAPTSDAAGYVLEAGVPVISWIGCPYYLLDAHDTLDKIEVSELQHIAETTVELVKIFMALN